MDDFQTKPIRPADLWEAIERVTRGAGRGTRTDPPSKQPSDSSRAPRPSPLAPPLVAPSPALLDAPVLLAACGGDPTLLGRMCQSFQARVPEQLAAIRDALRDQDTLRLREAAHKCCGTLSEFSTVAGDLAGNLEDLAAGAHLENAPPILEQLEAISRDVILQVNGLSIEALQAWSGPARTLTG
jgi:HPt (histidine-containing phosphotransfer) domain-containing protein